MKLETNVAKGAALDPDAAIRIINSFLIGAKAIEECPGDESKESIVVGARVERRNDSLIVQLRLSDASDPYEFSTPLSLVSISRNHGSLQISGYVMAPRLLILEPR